MTNEELEKYYQEYMLFECKKDVSNDFNKLLDNYKNEIGEKAAFPILKNDLLNVIAHKWMEQNKILKKFYGIINN